MYARVFPEFQGLQVQCNACQRRWESMLDSTATAHRRQQVEERAPQTLLPANQVGRCTHTRVDSNPHKREQPVRRSERGEVEIFVPAMQVVWIRRRASTEKAANKR